MLASLRNQRAWFLFGLLLVRRWASVLCETRKVGWSAVVKTPARFKPPILTINGRFESSMIVLGDTSNSMALHILTCSSIPIRLIDMLEDS